MSITVSTNSLWSYAISLLREMLGDSTTWRAIVEQPLYTWENLATLITAATSPENAALAKIKYGVLEDDPAHSDYVAPPRIGLRYPDTTDLQRLSTTGFTVNLTMIVTIEVPIPTPYLSSFQDSYIDFFNKVGGLIRDLKTLPKGAGVLDIIRIQMGPAGELDPKWNNGSQWIGGELLVECRGGT